MGPLGLIAGGGGLPVEVAETVRARGRPLFVVRLRGLAEDALNAFPGADVGLVELGRCVKALKGAGCRRVCFAGIVRRPDFSALKPDLKALRHLPSIMAAAREGDDALLRSVLAVFEREGFEVEPVQDVAPELLLQPGPLGAVSPAEAQAGDIAAAVAAAREVGRADAGQAAVARGGAVVAREADDGTDAMLKRLIAEGAAPTAARSGVLAKIPKPAQDLRVDLPTIGPATIRRAAEAGLAGVVGQAGALLVVDRPAVRRLADELGLFVLGMTPEAR